MENTRKWRWGKYRWIVLACILLSIPGMIYFTPIRPHIQVAPEAVMHEPLLTLPGIGDLYLTNTMVAMLLGDLVLFLIAFSFYRAVKGGSLVLKGLPGLVEAGMDMLYNLTETTAGKYTKMIFPWFATIMLIVLIANLIKMIPGFESIGWLEESASEGHAIQPWLGAFSMLLPATEEHGYVLVPWLRGLSTDLNFTAGLALISVIATQVVGFITQGPAYLYKFFNVRTLFSKPLFGFMDLLVSILELISEFAKIVSFAFRLFGVMFSGVVLVALVATMVPVFAPSLIYMFELFMGVIQAFVFGMLTMVFMAQATQGHGGEEHAEH
ncbi:MAG: F0F1 ATP synthase subunit A [Anaerolineae bacterium]|nr:F0F1 ATP synthase subunit A [Anaerolineae bacterium]